MNFIHCPECEKLHPVIDTKVVCLDCGTSFQTVDEFFDSMKEVLPWRLLASSS